MFTLRFISQKDPESTFRFLASGDAMELFAGGLLLPGIAQSKVSGKRIEVRDTWGLKHEELLVSVASPRSLVFYIKPNSLIKLLLKNISEEWRIDPLNHGSLVTRTFSLIPRFYTAPFLPQLEKILRKAIQKNNETLKLHLLFQEKELKKPLLDQRKGLGAGKRGIALG